MTGTKVDRPDIQSNCPNCFTHAAAAPRCAQCGFDWRSYTDNNKFLPPFTRIDGLTIGCVLGAGGFGIVYSGYLDRRGPVAVKEFFPERVELAHRSRDGIGVIPATQKEHNFEFWRQRFYQECGLLWEFRDVPGIVKPAREPMQANGTYYLIMERLCGCDLHDFIEMHDGRARRTLGGAEAMALYRRVLAALDALHRHRPGPVYHRDVTLKNIYLQDRRIDKIKLLDFGLAHSGENPNQPHTIAGTPEFSSPEQLSAHGVIGPYSDLYSLAAVMVAAVSGEPPPSPSVSAKRYAAESFFARPDLPMGFKLAVERCLNPEPRERPQSVQDVLALLDSEAPRLAVFDSPTLLADAGLDEPLMESLELRAESRRESPPPRRRLHLGTWLGWLAIAGALGAGGYFGAHRWPNAAAQLSSRQEHPAPNKVDVSFNILPGSAHWELRDSQNRLIPESASPRLAAGQYRVHITAPGYQPLTQDIDVGASPASFHFALASYEHILSERLRQAHHDIDHAADFTARKKRLLDFSDEISQLTEQNELSTKNIAALDAWQFALHSLALPHLQLQDCRPYVLRTEQLSSNQVSRKLLDTTREGMLLLLQSVCVARRLTVKLDPAFAQARLADAQGTTLPWQPHTRLLPGDYRLLVQAGGYENLERAFAVREMDVDLSLQLQSLDDSYLKARDGGPLEHMQKLQALAKQGHRQAQYDVARAFETGQGLEKNPAQAAVWYRRAADQNHSQAQSNLAYLYSTGTGVQQDERQAFYWYDKAARLGYAPAQYNLGLLHEQGKVTGKDLRQALYWFRKAAESGDARAQYSVGVYLASGHTGRKNETQAVSWYRKAAEQDNVDAQNSLGTMYQNGMGVTKDEKLAAQWFLKAAEHGNAQAQQNIAYMYEHGWGVEKNYEAAARWYRQAADQGNAAAQNNLGYFYFAGLGLQQNDALAVQWYRQAAAQDNLKAKFNLGYMYAFGKGVAKDERQAAWWYRKAAEGGDAAAQNNLGVIYERGEGVVQNAAEAQLWYRKAADQGNSSAMFNLGELLLPSRPEIAKAWLRKAAQQGYAKAREKLNDLLVTANPERVFDPLFEQEDDSQLSTLTSEFINAYQNGDIEGLMAQFARHAQTNDKQGINAIRNDYLQLFQSSISRRLHLHNRAWRRLTQRQAMLFSRYEAIVHAPGQAERHARGSVRLTAVKQNKKWRIIRLMHQND